MKLNIRSGRILASSIITAFISAVYVYAAQATGIKAIWLPFISWSLYVLSGGSIKNLPKIIFGLTAGMVIGCFSSYFSGLALSVVTFVMVMLILLSEFKKSIDLIPAYFFAYSGFFAFYFGNFKTTGRLPVEVVPEFFLLIMVGLVLGVSTMEIRNKILPAHK